MLNGKDLRKLVVPLSALIVFVFRYFNKDIDQEVVQSVLDGILLILITAGILQNPDKQQQNEE